MNLYDYLLSNPYYMLISSVILAEAILLLLKIFGKNNVVVLLIVLSALEYYLNVQYDIFLIVINGFVLFLLFVLGDY